MKPIRKCVVTLLLAAALSRCDSLAAQTRPAPPRPESAAAPSSEPNADLRDERYRWRPVIRIGQDYTLRAGDAVREVRVFFGSATIEGHVDHDVVVVFGKVQLASTASIDGSLIVVGGNAVTHAGARVDDDLVVVGGAFESLGDFAPGGQHIVVGPAMFGGRLDAIVPWLTRGLLWGRPIVPNLPWVWGVVGMFFLVYLVLNLVFDKPVGATAATLAERPLTAFVVGLLVLLLTGPVCLLLAVSVVGIAIVPFVICALFVAGVLGRVGAARWIGMSVVGQESAESRLQSLRSFAIGFAAISVAYMVPVLGFATWTLLGVFGLGAATLAFFTAYRQENPPPVPRVAPSVMPPAPAPYEERPASLPSPEVRAAAFSAPAESLAPPVASDLASFPRAAFLDRLAAFALDVILVVIAQELLNLTRHDSGVFLLLLAYHIGFWTWKGTTVGGIICQLRIVRVDGAPLRFVDALVRGLSSIFSLAVLGIGCLWILKDPERQAWHDKIAGTYVVKVPRNWPV